MSDSSTRSSEVRRPLGAPVAEPLDRAARRGVAAGQAHSAGAQRRGDHAVRVRRARGARPPRPDDAAQAGRSRADPAAVDDADAHGRSLTRATWRKTQHPTDRRQVLVELTEAGPRHRQGDPPPPQRVAVAAARETRARAARDPRRGRAHHRHHERRTVRHTFRSLRFFNYRVWAAGAIISNTGTWMQRVAQDWLVLTVLTDELRHRGRHHHGAAVRPDPGARAAGRGDLRPIQQAHRADDHPELGRA